MEKATTTNFSAYTRMIFEDFQNWLDIYETLLEEEQVVRKLQSF